MTTDDLTKLSDAELERRQRINSEYIYQVLGAGGLSGFMPGTSGCYADNDRITAELERRR